MFRDREEAGRRLARECERFAGRDVLVLAIPRGGVQVGYEVARSLGADFSLLVSRKLPYPLNPEAGFGAIAEGGEPFILRGTERYLSDDDIGRIVEEQREEIGRRIDMLRGGEPLPDLSGRTVILVDDGLAMGSTMIAAVALCRKNKAGKIVVAVPVSGAEAAREIERQADETVILEIPENFRAVAQVYRNWYDVPDSEVLEIMEQARKTK